MCFGLGLAPQKFSKLLKPVMVTLQKSGLTIGSYLDDLFQCERSYSQCWAAVQKAHKLLCMLGFLPNDDKSSYIPSQQLEMLGFILNSVTMRISLPSAKEEKVIELSMNLIRSPHCSIRHLCMVIGKLISCFPVVETRPMYYMSLEHCKLLYLQKQRWNYNAMCSLEFFALKELYWWVHNIHSAFAPINWAPPVITITSDTSNKGWAGTFNGVTANGHFTLEEQTFSINTKETLAIYFTVKCFAKNLSGLHVLFLADSTTALSYLKVMGSMKS